MDYLTAPTNIVYIGRTKTRPTDSSVWIPRDLAIKGNLVTTDFQTFIEVNLDPDYLLRLENLSPKSFLVIEICDEFSQLLKTYAADLRFFYLQENGNVKVTYENLTEI